VVLNNLAARYESAVTVGIGSVFAANTLVCRRRCIDSRGCPDGEDPKPPTLPWPAAHLAGFSPWFSAKHNPQEIPGLQD